MRCATHTRHLVRAMCITVGDEWEVERLNALLGKELGPGVRKAELAFVKREESGGCFRRRIVREGALETLLCIAKQKSRGMRADPPNPSVGSNLVIAEEDERCVVRERRTLQRFEHLPFDPHIRLENDGASSRFDNVPPNAHVRERRPDLTRRQPLVGAIEVRLGQFVVATGREVHTDDGVEPLHADVLLVGGERLVGNLQDRKSIVLHVGAW